MQTFGEWRKEHRDVADLLDKQCQWQAEIERAIRRQMLMPTYSSDSSVSFYHATGDGDSGGAWKYRPSVSWRDAAIYPAPVRQPEPMYTLRGYSPSQVYEDESAAEIPIEGLYAAAEKYKEEMKKTTQSKGENEGMEKYLTDLVIDLGLTKEQLAEIRKIMRLGAPRRVEPILADDWLVRLSLRQLALAVQTKGLTAEDLGYHEEEKD